MRMNITSAAGVIALLDEKEPDVKQFALSKLNEIVDDFWHEISEAIGRIEVLYEDKQFQHRNLAALVASKVFYHLGSFEDSVTYALGAGDLFNVNASSEYAETIVAKCIDQYVRKRVHNEECDASQFEPIDARLEAIVERMFTRCFEDKQIKQAIGLALETRRMDMFDQAIHKSDDVSSALSYAFKVSLSLIQNRKFRHMVHRALVALYMSLGVPDYISVCQCYIFLDDAQAVAEILEKLLQKTEDSVLMAYQIGFDLYESATQDFLQRVLNALRKTPASTTSTVAADDATMEVDDAAGSIPATAPTPAAAAETAKPLSEADRIATERLQKLETILSGDITIG